MLPQQYDPDFSGLNYQSIFLFVIYVQNELLEDFSHLNYLRAQTEGEYFVQYQLQKEEMEDGELSIDFKASL